MPKHGKVLALDYGSKRIGVASGDLEHRIAFPRDVIENSGNVVLRICELCKENAISFVIVGLPLPMEEKQKENAIMNDVQYFVENLRAEGLKVEFFDERLSSFEAGQKVGLNGHIDAQAAQIVLQRYFDQL